MKSRTPESNILIRPETQENTKQDQNPKIPFYMPIIFLCLQNINRRKAKSQKEPSNQSKHYRSIKLFSKTGKVENRAVSESEKTNHESFKDNNIQKEQETPVPDPKRWRYIFYLALLAVGVFLYFKRKEIFKNVKRFFSK
ncbi:hypothetical protein DWV99_10470 [Bacteroides uniformis]|nr:hypothetical protein DWV99_10470 [Bacteroides uniformis]